MKAKLILEILEEGFPDSFVICRGCGNLMREGYYVHGDSYCGPACVDKDPDGYSYRQLLVDMLKDYGIEKDFGGMGVEELEEMCSKIPDLVDENTETFWTTWDVGRIAPSMMVQELAQLHLDWREGSPDLEKEIVFSTKEE